MEQTHGTSKSGAKSPQAGRPKAATRVSSKSKKILDLQRSAGNRAVSGAVMNTRQPELAVQRQPELTLQRLSWEDFVDKAFPGGDSEAAVLKWADKMAGRGGGGGDGDGAGAGAGAGAKLGKTVTGGGSVSTPYVRPGTGTKLSESAQKLQIKRDLLDRKAKGEELTDDEKTILDKTEKLTDADQKILDDEEKRVKEAKAYESYQAKQKADAEKAAKQTQLEEEDKERTKLAKIKKVRPVDAALSNFKSSLSPKQAALEKRKKSVAEALKGRKF